MAHSEHGTKILGGPLTPQTDGREPYWSESDVEEKIKRLREVVKSQRQDIQNLRFLVQQLIRHSKQKIDGGIVDHSRRSDVYF